MSTFGLSSTSILLFVVDTSQLLLPLDRNDESLVALNADRELDKELDGDRGTGGLTTSNCAGSIDRADFLAGGATGTDVTICAVLVVTEDNRGAVLFAVSELLEAFTVTHATLDEGGRRSSLSAIAIA